MALERPWRVRLQFWVHMLGCAGVGGWLLLFCVIATVIAPLLLIAEAAAKGVIPLLLVSAGVCALSVYAGIGLWRVASDALKWVKIYFIAQLALGSLALLAAIAAGSDPPTAAGELLWTVVWYLYFHKSVRVRLTYGKNL